MRLEDQSLSPATWSKESSEMANIEDRLGTSGIDSASKSGMSSKPDWETVITHLPKGGKRMNSMISGRRDSNGKGWASRPKEGGRGRKPLGKLSVGRIARTDDDVLVVVESQAARLSDMDIRNKAMASENSEIKSALLRSREDLGAMKSQMEQMAELLKSMASVKEMTNGRLAGKGEGDQLPTQEGGGVSGLEASSARSSNDEKERGSNVEAICMGLGSPVASPAKELGHAQLEEVNRREASLVNCRESTMSTETGVGIRSNEISGVGLVIDSAEQRLELDGDADRGELKKNHQRKKNQKI
jgi:hypothetical protein